MKQLLQLKTILVIFFLCQFASPLFSLHIVGGEMTYVCNGGNSYTFTVKMYRDGGSGGAQFDNPAYFGIYNNGDFLEQITASPTNITTLPFNIISDICFEIGGPPNTQSAEYIFTTTLALSEEDYTISYQRCCRNETINNIETPGDVGMTYTINVSGLSQETCNNSPTFSNDPPLLLCVGESVNFDCSGTDMDGDSLSYSFCTPLVGGGIDGTPSNPNGDPNGPTGVQPIPPTGPPYNTVTFINPPYSDIYPMGGNPLITIDPLTGIIDGIPSTLGQYEVGVCMTEYRDGITIGEVRKDFQFNIIDCSPSIELNTEVSQTEGTLTAQAIGVNYQWLDCNNNYEEIVGATEKVFVPSEVGSYAVRIIGVGCSSISECYDITTVGTLDNAFAQSIDVSPNPVKNSLLVHFNENYNDVKVRLMNLMGQVILENNLISGNQIELQIGNYPSGLYLLSLQSTDGKRTVFKVIKE